MLEFYQWNILGAGILAFALCYFVIPSVINVANIKHLYDDPNERKSHTGAIPTLGGLGIFSGFIVSACLFCDLSRNNELQYIFAALLIVFMMGAKDDIVELAASKKLLGQIVAAFIITYYGDIRLTSFYGIFNISDIPFIASILFSMFTIIVVVNAFNLIDGVNLLSGSIAVVIALTFGSWFYFHGFFGYAVMAMALIGSILAFLKYNYTPAKIFMGDSGSLTIGLLVSIFAIQFIELNEIVIARKIDVRFTINSTPAMAIAIMIIPLFDTIRAFTLRILNGKSPFAADRNHIHHKFLDLGFSHIQTSMILVVVNILFIVIGFLLQSLENLWLIVLLFIIGIVLSFILFSFKSKTQKLP
jgi:UDP-GlcNAc:undecaprenyl-phosphate GlcNAc-1-phosphate transferase